LLGLRINIWPWQFDFEEIEELLDKYVDSIERTPRLANMLKARISSSQIQGLHFRLEAGFSFSQALSEVLAVALHGVPKVQMYISAILSDASAMADVSKSELARRKAQSKKDKQGPKVTANKPGKVPQATRQQNSPRPVVAPKSNNMEVASVLAAMIDPDDSDAFRLPGGAPTFVNKLRRKVQVQSPPAGAPMQVNAGFAVIRRDPRLASVHYEYKGTGQSSTYALRSQSNPATLRGAASAFIPVALAENTAGYDRHDSKMIPVVYRDGLARIWFQHEQANASQIVFGGLTISTAYSGVISWVLNGINLTDNINFTTDASGNATLTLGAFDRMGYVAISLNAAIAAATISLVDNSKNIFRHLPLPELFSSALDVDNMRVNAASAMLSDRSSILITQGNCLSYQAGGGEDWSSLLELNPNTNLSIDPYGLAARSQKPFTAPYKEGRYIPLKPVDNPFESVMLEMFDGGVPASVSPIVMSQQTDYLYVAFNVGSVDGGGSNAAEYTMVWDVEGETDSQWFENEIPHIHPDVIKEARYIFSQQICNFGNPGHLSKIWGWVKRNAPKVLNAIEGASAFLPPQYAAPVAMGARVGRGALGFINSLN